MLFPEKLHVFIRHVYILKQTVVRLKQHYQFGLRNEGAFFVEQELILLKYCLHKYKV
jgi:hypothetical protein